MSDFYYQARNAQGGTASGQLTADSKRDALDMLHRLGLFPISVKKVGGVNTEIKWFQPRVSDSLVSNTLSQLADLLENGVPVLQSFQVLVKQTTNSTFREVLSNIHDRVADGESIDSAFAAHSNIFSTLTISIVRAGVEGAFLEEALRRTAKFLDQQADLRNKIVGAMIYPTILMIVGITVVLVLLIVFVPMFDPFFEIMRESGEQLPMITQFILALREIIVNYGLYVLGALVILGIFVQGQLATAWGKRFLDTVKLYLPIIGSILLSSAVSRLCRVLGTLLENGVPILRALDISSQSTGNAILSEAVRQSAENVSSGEPLSKPLAETGIVPPQVMAMITVAEESNTLETVLVNIADTIERNTSRQLDTIVRLIEPIMLLGMAGAVFVIIVSLLLPIQNLGKAVM